MTGRGREVVVVGAGPNGLSAAVALARAGLHVTVHEAAGTIGGGAKTEELTLPGFRHDVCSAVHPMGAASPFFRQLPLAEFGLDWIAPPVPMAHPFDDGTAAVLVPSVDATADSLGAADARAYRRLMNPFVRHWEAVIAEALAPPLRIPRHPLLMARLGLTGLPPASRLARRSFSSDRARAFFLGIAAHALMPMTMAPSAGFGIMLALAGHAVGWPIARGGSQAISDALAGVLRRHGGEIVTGSPVRSVAALSDAAAVVLDLTPRQVLAVARLPLRYRRQLARYRYAPGVFKVDWALAEPIPWTAAECRAAGTIHIGQTSAAIEYSASAAWTGGPDHQPCLILSQPSLFDPSRAPAGRHTAWAYCHVPHGSTEDRTEAIERQIERFAPGFREIVLARHTMNTRQLETHNENMVGGDVNGGVQDLRQFFFRPAPRLDPYATPVEGLFLCSASTPPGGAVHGMCGFNAAASVLRRMK
ncbi:MAG: phytoene desaturase family protein [Betaproteobacteria bacterium]